MSSLEVIAGQERQGTNTPKRLFFYRWGWRQWLLATALVFCGGSGAANLWYWFGPKAWGPRLACRDPVVKLGRVTAGTPVKRTFTLENTGAETVEIGQVIPECSCTAARLEGVRLGPGESVTLPVTVKVEGRPGPFRKQVVVQSNTPSAGLLVLRLQGEVITGQSEGE